MGFVAPLPTEPSTDEGDDLLADLALFYCDTATFGENSSNIQQVWALACFARELRFVFRGLHSFRLRQQRLYRVLVTSPTDQTPVQPWESFEPFWTFGITTLIFRTKCCVYCHQSSSCACSLMDVPLCPRKTRARFSRGSVHVRRVMNQ